jgi:hypothetical protein
MIAQKTSSLDICGYFRYTTQQKTQTQKECNMHILRFWLQKIRRTLQVVFGKKPEVLTKPVNPNFPPIAPDVIKAIEKVYGPQRRE